MEKVGENNPARFVLLKVNVTSNLFLKVSTSKLFVPIGILLVLILVEKPSTVLLAPLTSKNVFCSKIVLTSPFTVQINCPSDLIIATGVRPEERLQAKASKVEVALSPVAYLLYAKSSVTMVCRSLGK